MLKQRLDDKFHIVEVLKWGIFDGALVGGFVALLTIVHAKRDQIISLAGAGSWEFGASLFLILLVSISAIVTSTLTFAHPIYSLMHGEYKDAIVTVIVSLLTILIIGSFVIWSTPYLT